MESHYLVDSESIIGFTEHENYYKAKIKGHILFKEFSVNDLYLKHDGYCICSISEIENYTIEDLISLCPNDVIFTEVAIKSIGL